MTTELTIIIAVAAAVIAAVLTYIISASKSKAVLGLTRENYERLLSDAKASGEAALAEAKAAGEKAVAEAKASGEKALAEAKNASEEALKALRNEMTASTEKILKARTEELEAGNKANMDSILAPLKESIEKMNKAMNDNAQAHVESNSRLSEKLEQAVKDMGERTANVGAKADVLSEALTGRPKMQGNWGENFLDDILANEGLVKGMHYTREDAREDRSRPDFIFHFKEGQESKDLVVDSKVSLTAFVSYMNETDPDRKKSFLEDHVKSVRRHIDELSAKDYFKKLDKGTAFTDYVLMFMPIDMAFRAAMDADPMLWQYAYSKGVLISTEQTIMPFLKILRITWNKYQEDSNVKEIMDAATLMIDRVGLFYDSYKRLGAKLKGVCDEYNDGLIKVTDHGPSIKTSADTLLKAGVRRSKGRALSAPDSPVDFLPES